MNWKQQVMVNSNESEILLTGKCSVSQGSVLSRLLYIIFTLDIHDQMLDIQVILNIMNLLVRVLHTPTESQGKIKKVSKLIMRTIFKE